MCLEEQMQTDEVGPVDVPVKILRLDPERVRRREHRTKARGDVSVGLAVVGISADLRASAMVVSISATKRALAAAAEERQEGSARDCAGTGYQGRKRAGQIGNAVPSQRFPTPSPRSKATRPTRGFSATPGGSGRGAVVIGVWGMKAARTRAGRQKRAGGGQPMRKPCRC